MEMLGKSFRVQGTHGFETFISVVDETDEGLVIHMTSNTLWGTKESTEILSKDLFDSCVRTGYLAESA